jgi:predicted phosphodiesterase
MARLDQTLVIGDAHVAPGQDLRRFDWANGLIRDIEPDRIVIIGDFVTMDSLSAWDKDKRKIMENRRYALDINAGREGLERMFNKVHRNIDVIYCEGNHENRTDRYLDYHPELEGQVNVEHDLLRDIREEGYIIEYIKYKHDWNHKGVSFTHVPIQENGKAVGGKYAVQKALSIYHNSVVFGHTHKLDTAGEHRHNAPHLNQALNVGCFFEHVDEYAKGSVTSYWRGLVVLDHYSDNRFDFATYSLGRLKDVYS